MVHIYFCLVYIYTHVCVYMYVSVYICISPGFSHGRSALCMYSSSVYVPPRGFKAGHVALKTVLGSDIYAHVTYMPVQR